MTQKGLAIRDITAPGFQPPLAGVRDNSEGGMGSGDEGSPGTTTLGSGGVAANVEAHAAGAGAGDDKKVEEICFNCWSQGNGQTCTLHKAAAAAAGGKAGDARPAESALMCKNWDVGILRRRYRSEELQVKRERRCPGVERTGGDLGTEVALRNMSTACTSVVRFDGWR